MNQLSKEEVKRMPRESCLGGGGGVLVGQRRLEKLEAPGRGCGEAAMGKWRAVKRMHFEKVGMLLCFKKLSWMILHGIPGKKYISFWLHGK